MRYRALYNDKAKSEQSLRYLAVQDKPEVVIPNEAQQEALGQLTVLRERDERRAAVVAATGVGKTYLAAFDVRQSGAKRVLYVSHRLGLVGDGHNGQDADIVLATVASLRNRPELVARDWDYLVIDEFHHAEAASYQVLRPIREQAFLPGLTATPERQDGRDVLEWCDLPVLMWFGNF